jgi:hypothetical protein
MTYLLVPASVLTLWLYAHYRDVTWGRAVATWREGSVLRTGNPYSTPPRSLTWHEPLPSEDVFADAEGIDDAYP